MTPLEFKLWRVAQGLSQRKCARLFGVSQSAVSWWECHRVPDWVEREVCHWRDFERREEAAK